MSFKRFNAIAAFVIGVSCLVSCGDNSSSAEFWSSSSEVPDWNSVSSVDESCSSREFVVSSSSDELVKSSSSVEPDSSGEHVESSNSVYSSSFVESSSSVRVESSCSVESSSSEFMESSSSAESNSSESPAVSSSSKSLNGVVWYVVGDSFSAGDFEGLDPKPTIKEGKYAGKLPVYSYLIGNRTGCDVRNIAAGGTTICYYDTYGFTKPENGIMYRTDFSDADIITIYYGINDSHNQIPIGNIDDMDPTTFYGAFNVALDYLTKNYPKAKIGIIVSNGCDTEDYPEATEQIAIKWGLPYLDLDGGVNGITMLRSSSRNPTPDAEKKEILKQQWVHEHNWHPNEYAHELESHFIEEWLLTLL
ncbi:SGNH/GDSL hydrolase family protein [Fibrobacter sp.]|uniref:SGNH/GDSL hydrolase family protein n=1 Tax=Fibrobacter sp. TaxID=35828 RepID=UPI0025C0C3DE|nr:SGNH/GDSL hydrolase family protein [Fibrobacter sp.]MBR3073431.1 SGNH/GDSL hydrolase family protein [Fibrobacter sp.]